VCINQVDGLPGWKIEGETLIRNDVGKEKQKKSDGYQTGDSRNRKGDPNGAGRRRTSREPKSYRDQNEPSQAQPLFSCCMVVGYYKFRFARVVAKLDPAAA
jgi:hypothetical protein